MAEKDNDSTASSPNVKGKKSLLERRPPTTVVERKAKTLKKGVLCRPEEDDDSDFYLNYHPSDTIGYEGCMFDFSIPDWMPMTFRPTKSMGLNDLCAYTAAYIFKPDYAELIGREVLVKTTSKVIGDRKAFKSLIPRTAVDQEILNLVVARQNWLIDIVGSKKSVWYMATEFAAIILEEILVHKSYGDNITPCSPERMISTFSLCKPRHIQQQRPGSHDYGHITVNTATRMKLAIHLVKSKNNLMYDDVLSKAAAYWREEVHKRDFLVSC
ncbi:hypothetical protein TSUD_99940 [Trifolium subterraneum]|uniref:Uncharacterized protein n=1 Tax=Trifolium subterraneum TaxID=3900 RepID=A0A2Z6PSK8_TRISU|nr:hypothetical protein TSUD_99940 [Trifolium subterraneum]